MLSILTQNKDIVYYKPNIQKFYVLEKDRDKKIAYEEGEREALCWN